MLSLTDLLQVAIEAASTTGALLRDNQERWAVVEGVVGREVKLAADREAESAAVAVLRRTGLAILSEESGKMGGDNITRGHVWVLHPLDGSVNYFRGSPHCAVSIALLSEGKPVLRVVDCFLLGEHFSCVSGQGASLNGASVRVSAVSKPADGILQTGIPSRMDDDRYAAFEKRLKGFQKIRMIGSAATALAHVATGRADAYRESGGMIWDVAAGCALVEATGGCYKWGDGPIDEKLEVAASNGLIDFPTNDHRDTR